MGFTTGGTIRLPVFQVADAAARTTKTDMLTGDLLYQIDTKVWYSYDGAAWNAVATSATTLLGSGNWEKTTTGLQNMASFTTGGGLGDGTLIIVMNVKRTAGADVGNRVGINSVNNALADPWRHHNFGSETRLKFEIQQDAINTTDVTAISVIGATTAYIVSDTRFDFSADETIYINADMSVIGNNFKCIWTAWLVQ